ncbi:protein translocase subunit SecD [bacterium]|nr:protein translocase subunit SecD [bacterium]
MQGPNPTMQKILNGKLIFVLVATALCLYLTFPTFRYFWVVNGMGDNPTAEQVALRNELVSQRGVIKLGLDLQGGADFLLAVDTDRLQRQKLENEAEGIRKELTRENDIDASVLVEELPEGGLQMRVRVNEERYLDLAADTIKDYLTRHPELVAQGDVRAGIAGEGLIIDPTEEGTDRTTREAVDAALDVIKKRVDSFGLTNPIVTRAGAERIRVQVPGETNPDRIRNSLLRTASLEFRLLHPQHSSVITEFVQGGAGGMVTGLTGRVRQDLLEEVDSEAGNGKKVKRLKDNIANVPAGYVLRLGRYSEKDQKTGIPVPGRTFEDLVYMVASDVPLGGVNLRRATAYTDLQSLDDPVVVNIEFDREGSDAFAQITTEATDRFFAIILDDEVYSAPRINEPILGGRARISGGFSQVEARDLSNVLKAGALPAPLKVIEENTIGASLGADSIRDSGRAIVIGGVIIIILMVAIYATCGVVSVLAMALNVLLILAVLSLMGATLTLSGIGGILLTMGMAVDANILIYERLREEIHSGKPLRAAINAAFDRAGTVILDSNITSILPALVLVLFEVVDGSMKGFWTAMAIGLIANLYTGIVVTRALIEAWFAKYKTVSVGTFRLLDGVKINWMSYRKLGFAFSGGLTAICVAYLVISGPSFGIDFTGGVLATAEIKETTSADRGKLVEELSKEFTDVRVIRVVNKDQWQITVPQIADKKTGEVPTLQTISDKVDVAVTKLFPGTGSIASVQSVDPTVGGEFKVVAFASLIIVSIVILGYLALRFQWIFGAGAVLALVHDVFLSMGVFKLMGHSLTLDIVSALLIILGYSVNDTIVVFDRVREKMQDRLSAHLDEIINAAINETLSRTLLTSGTTFAAVLIMYLFGGVGLSDFALILLLGVGFGTYSSIFIASVLVYMYLESKGITTVVAARKATARVAYQKTKTTG